MSLGRYKFSKKIRGSRYFGTSNVSHKISKKVDSGEISTTNIILAEGQRLDQLAGATYGDSSLWWIIAAASNIGYCLQVQAGTLIRIPVSLNEVYNSL
jgi:hypothetical protein